jgi:hypothetical protein
MIDTCTTPMLSVYDGREIGELTTHSGDDRPGLLDQHEQVSRELHAATINDPLRRRLPQRRGAIAVELEHAGHRFRMCFPDGALGEVFLDAAKQNSGLDAFAADAAILVSLLLQHNVTPAEIGHALRRAPDGTAASLIGAVIDRLVEEGGAPQRLQNGGT